MIVLLVTLAMLTLLLFYFRKELEVREAEAAECQRLLETLQSQHAILQDTTNIQQATVNTQQATINIQHDRLHQQRLLLEGKGSADT